MLSFFYLVVICFTATDGDEEHEEEPDYTEEG